MKEKGLAFPAGIGYKGLTREDQQKHNKQTRNAMNAITTNTATHLIQHHTINNAGFVVFESRWWRRGADRNTWARYDAETRELTVQKTSRGIITDDYRAEIGDFCAEYGIDFETMRHGDRVTVVLPEPADAAITVTNNRRRIMDLAGDAVTAAWHNALDMAACGDENACTNYIETVRRVTENEEAETFAVIAMCDVDETHLREVIDEMKILGTPHIRAVYDETYDAFIALEGSHRIAACKLLGITPIIEEVAYEDMALCPGLDIDTYGRSLEEALGRMYDEAWERADHLTYIFQV